LRVAAEEIAARYEGVAYFPSYEVITGNHARGRYFADGLRDVTEEGVSHVMRLFMKHYAVAEGETALSVETKPDVRRLLAESVRQELQEVVAVMCDESKLDIKGYTDPQLVAVNAPLAMEEANRETAQTSTVSAMDFLRGDASAPPEIQTDLLRRGFISRLRRLTLR
jgi:hypothetical protein